MLRILLAHMEVIHIVLFLQAMEKYSLLVLAHLVS